MTRPVRFAVATLCAAAMLIAPAAQAGAWHGHGYGHGTRVGYGYHGGYRLYGARRGRDIAGAAAAYHGY